MTSKSRYLASIESAAGAKDDTKSIGSHSHNSFHSYKSQPPPPPPPPRSSFDGDRSQSSRSSRRSQTERDQALQDDLLAKSFSAESIASSISNPPPPPPPREQTSTNTSRTDELLFGDNGRTEIQNVLQEENSFERSEFLQSKSGENSFEGKESVAARRRRKAQSASMAASGSKISFNLEPSQADLRKMKEELSKNVDPPLVLYASDDDSTDDGDEEDAVMNGDKKKGKSGFFKVKSFIRRGPQGKKTTTMNTSPNRSKSFRSDKYDGKRSAEVVVDKAKLAESASKFNEQPPWQKERENTSSNYTRSDLKGREGSTSQSRRSNQLKNTGHDGDNNSIGSNSHSSELSNPRSRDISSKSNTNQPSKETTQSTLRERSGTPSESESSMDQSESAAPLINTKVLHPLRETDEEKAAKFDSKKAGANDDPFGSSFFDPSTDEFFTSKGNMDAQGFFTSDDPFDDPFFQNSDAVAKQAEPKERTDTVDDPPLDLDIMNEVSDDSDSDEEDEHDIVEQTPKPTTYRLKTMPKEPLPMTEKAVEQKAVEQKADDRNQTPPQRHSSRDSSPAPMRGRRQDSTQFKKFDPDPSRRNRDLSPGKFPQDSAHGRDYKAEIVPPSRIIGEVQSVRDRPEQEDNSTTKPPSVVSESEKTAPIHNKERPSRDSQRSERIAARKIVLEMKAQDQLIKFSNKNSSSRGSRAHQPSHVIPDPELEKDDNSLREELQEEFESETVISDTLGKPTISNGRGDHTTFVRKKASPLQPLRRKQFKAPDGVFDKKVSSYASEISDPIQRAGVRLLSAAAVPIQTEIRRYLAKKRAAERLWALTVVQSYFRRWKSELTRFKHLYHVTKIQACFRGWLLRDTLEDEHFCATQIQKIARGYLATMQVYEDLYNITVVQSLSRRNAALKEADRRRTAIVNIQRMYRGYNLRSDLEIQNYFATMIQTKWRSYSAQLKYQFDIVDVIIAQSIFRRKAAQHLAASLLHQKQSEAATVIQTTWRSYDCTMNYLHSIADILIVQSVVRRWSAMRFVPKYRAQVHNGSATTIQTAVRAWSARVLLKKMKAAVKIQSAWRGFQCYIDYIFTMADVVIAQRTARQWLAIREVRTLRQEKKDRTEKAAATQIQKIWRGYHAHMNMLFTLVHIIVVQSVIRRKLAIVKFVPMKMENRAAIKVQSVFRAYLVRSDYVEYISARKLQAVARGLIASTAYRRCISARAIQAHVRRMIAERDLKEYKTARTIQTWYRCQSIRSDYVVYTSVRKIQSQWRGFEARRMVADELWLREDAAVTIQKTWRMFYNFSSYTIMSYEKQAATTIQKHWRGFWQFSHYVIYKFEIIRIQAFIRGCLYRKKLRTQDYAATLIQSGARTLMAKRYCHMERLIAAMVNAASMSLATRLAAKRIQRWYRVQARTLKEKRAVRVIERFFIWVRMEVEREIERREKMKLVKRQKQRRRRKNEEETLLETVWNNTLPDNDTLSEKKGTTQKKKKDKSFRPSSARKNLDTHQNSKNRSSSQRKLTTTSSSRKQVTGGRGNSNDPTPARFSFYDPNEMVHGRQLPRSSNESIQDNLDAQSDVSGLTTPSVFSPQTRLPKKTHNGSTSGSKQPNLDDPLEKAWNDTTDSVKRGFDGGSERRKLTRADRNHSMKENAISNVERPRRPHRNLMERRR